jgi:hypothetical protein
LDNLLLDVDEAGIYQPLLGDIAVQADGAAEAIHGIKELVRPSYGVGIPWQGAVVAARIPVYLNLLKPAVVWFQVSGHDQQELAMLFAQGLT